MADSFIFNNNNVYASSSPDPDFTLSPFRSGAYPTFNGNDFYQTNLQPLSPSLNSFLATPDYASPDQEFLPTTSDFFDKDALLFAESPVEEESPQSPKFLGDYFSLFPLQTGQSCDRKDSFTSSGSLSPVIDHMISSTTPQTATTSNRPEHTASKSDAKYSDKSSQSPVSESGKRRYSSRRSSKGTGRSPGAHRLDHNTIEKRYRTNLNAQINNLRHVISTEDKSDSQQPSKSAVLAAARKYILELQMQNKRMEKDLEEAKKKSRTYEQLLTDHLRKTRVKVTRIGRP
ncbi:hypothetical protein ACEPPN_010987 [Leptodophora sp. 'Broadleaf-Isolate-01']